MPDGLIGTRGLSWIASSLLAGAIAPSDILDRPDYDLLGPLVFLIGPIAI